MRSRALLLTLVVLLAACGASSATTTSRTAAGRCGPATAHTLASSAVARVYVSGHTVFGCSTKHPGRRIALGDAQNCQGRTEVGQVVVKGEVAAYGTLNCAIDTGFGSIVVRRLDTGKTLHSDSAVQGPLPPEGFSSVASLVLKPGGSVAWIGTGHSIVSNGNQVVQVHKIDRDGSVLLDSGRPIRPRSLRLRASQVSWRHGSHTRTAALR